MADAILSINAGSSSLKFAAYPVTDGEVGAADLSGQVEGLQPGGSPLLQISPRAGGSIQARPTDWPQGESAYEAALNCIVAAVRERTDLHLRAIAHRVVHGGSRYRGPVRVDADRLIELRGLEHLAPLHQPHNLRCIEVMQRLFPSLPQVACFDTAFHASMPEREARFALPDDAWKVGIRRYGFHGLSYQSITATLRARTPRVRGRAVLAHLGSGSSLCATVNGQSRATTMGFSALEGLMMGTRCGSLDAGVVLHMLNQGESVERIERLLYRESGLLGVSGLSADFRTLRASSTEGAKRALEMYTHRVVRECGAMMASIGGIDLLAFTGGIGEHDAQLRAEVAVALAWTGLRIDSAANRAADGSAARAVHALGSPIEMWVIPTDEGRVAASDAWHLCAPSYQPETLS